MQRCHERMRRGSQVARGIGNSGSLALARCFDATVMIFSDREIHAPPPQNGRSTPLVAPYCAIPRDYLSDTPLLRAMGFLVSQHSQLGAIPPPPFLSVSPLESMQSGGAIPPPPKGYLSDTRAIPYENKANGCDTPLCDTISEGYCAIWGGVSRAGPLSQRRECKIGGGAYFCRFYSFRAIRTPPPPKYHLLRKVFGKDGAWLAVPCFLFVCLKSTRMTLQGRREKCANDKESLRRREKERNP